MNNALLYLGGLLVVMLAALFAVPHFVDWNGYRGVFEEEATKVLGRDVRVGGGVNVRFLPTPYVKFEKVRIADPTGQTGEPFVRVESFTMRLSGPALLRGVLEANEIELHKPILTLALDGQGSGNWASLQIKAGALPFVPSDVSLHSVRLIDGAIALFNAEAQPIGRADAIHGEFSADGLRGPYKFKGKAVWGGEERDLRFSTTALNADGTFQIKAAVRALKSESSYALDGRVDDLAHKPHLVGELAGKIPLKPAASPSPVAATPATATPPAKTPTVEPADVPTIDLKSRIDVTTSGAKVDDIAMSVENSAEPQLLTGSATAQFGKDARLDLALASKWLDLDRLAGAGQNSATFLRVKQLGLSLLRGLAGSGTAHARIDVDQVKLGGETAGGLFIDAERRGAAVRLTQLRAGLPGGSRLSLAGDVKDDTGGVSFAGAGSIQGTNVARLLAWAAKSGAVLDVAADGPFSADGHVTITDTRFELTEASADIGGRPFSGDVVVSGEGRRRVAVTLEAARLDSSELFPDTSRALEDKLRQAFGFPALARTPPPTVPGAPAGPAAGDAAQSVNDASDISVRVLAGELKHGDQTFRDVDATLGLEAGNIRIPAARFTTARGLVVAIDARFDGSGDRAKGTLGYDLTASSSDAIKDFAQITGFTALIPADRLAETNAARLAGLVKLGARAPTSADISVDGTLQLARISASAQFDGGIQSWRSDPSRLHVTARSPALASLLAAFGLSASAAPPAGQHEAELVFASTGPLATGASAVLEVTAPGFDSRYSGRVAAPGDTPVVLAGLVSVRADDMRDALTLAGVPAARGLTATPLDGKIEIKRDSAGWTLALRQFTAGTSKLAGAINVSPKSDGPARLSGYVSADTITIAGLLAPLLDKRGDAAAVPTSGKPNAWPDAVFNFEPLTAITGDLRVRFGVLQLQPNVSMRDGALKLAFAPGNAAISEITGQVAGGAVSGALQLAKSTGGIALDGTLKIAGADLAKIGTSASGKATIEASAKAQAMSPAALIAVLTGAGTLTFDAGRIPAPTQSVAANVVADVIANKLPNTPDALTEAIETRSATSVVDFGSRSVPFAISDGIAKLEVVKFEAADGTVTASTMVDLMALSLDSAWKVSAVVPPLAKTAEDVPGWTPAPPKGPLPPASVVYTGALSNLSALDVNVDAGDMQRELAVRQMERNVEDLERLRRLDEHRAKLEQERRRALDAERAAAAAAAAAAKAAAQDAAAPLPPVIPDSANVPNATTAPSSDARPTTITIEPIPITPSAERPAVQPPQAARPQAARTPPARPPSERRTTSDEVIRSLGGVP